MPNTTYTTKTLIIGSGPAGFTAAIYAARAGLDPILVTGNNKGGQLTITTDVENYPGFADPIQGPWLMEQMEKQAKNCGAMVVAGHIVAVEVLEGDGVNVELALSDAVDAAQLEIASGAPSDVIQPGVVDMSQGTAVVDSATKAQSGAVQSVANNPGKLPPAKFKATDQAGNTYFAATLIISTGADAKWLGLESEKAYQGRGVSGCATCDGFFFRGKKVMVVGGGNTAAEEALYLTNHATKVLLIHRRDKLRADQTLQRRLFVHPKIEIIWDTALDEVLGDDERGVTAARLRNLKSGELVEVAVDGIFVAIGHTPNSAVFRDFIETDAAGYIITQPDSSATNVPGVFAAGDVQDRHYRQAVTAAGTGCMAALEAERYLSERFSG